MKTKESFFKVFITMIFFCLTFNCAFAQKNAEEPASVPTGEDLAANDIPRVNSVTTNEVNLLKSNIIDNGSTVGIGITSPCATCILDVNGETTFRGGHVNFNDGSGDYDFVVKSDLDDWMFFVDASTDRIGVRTSAPNSTLDVHGSANFNGGMGDFDFQIAGDNEAVLFYADASSDRIGIGINTPATQLDVTGGAYFNSGGGNNDVRISGNIQTNLLYADASADGIGIGTSAPNARLDVWGDAIFNDEGIDWDFRIETENKANMFFVDGNTDYVGINTNAPGANLHTVITEKDLNFKSSTNITGIDNSGGFFSANQINSTITGNENAYINLHALTILTSSSTNPLTPSIAGSALFSTEHDGAFTAGILGEGLYTGTADDNKVTGGNFESAVDDNTVAAFAVGSACSALSDHDGWNIGAFGESIDADYDAGLAGFANTNDITTPLGAIEAAFTTGFTTAGYFYNDNDATTDYGIYVDGDAHSYIQGDLGIGTNAPAYQLELSVNSAGKPGTNTWTVTSDARLKTDVQPYQDGLDELLKIAPITFRYNNESGYATDEEYVGVIAQELQKVAPYMVGSFEKDGAEYLDVNNGAMTYMLINAVKELNAELEAKDELIETQAEELALVKEQLTRLDDLEAKMNNLEGCCQARITTGNASINADSLGDEASLGQNVPNPFSGNTEISFYVPHTAAQAAIMVFDIEGRVIKNERIDSRGAGTVTFNSDELTTGVYFYSLFIDKVEIDTKQMILTK